jgi:hypothetical protein
VVGKSIGAGLPAALGMIPRWPNPPAGSTGSSSLLGEQVDARIVVGVALIVGVVAAVNLRRAGAPSASGGLPAEA